MPITTTRGGITELLVGLLEDLLNVKITNPQAGQGIVYSNGEWINAAVGGTPAGLDTQIQYNDSGSFGGDAAFNYDKTTNKLSVLEDLGSELAPALTAGNWTLGTGLVFGTNTIIKNANGMGLITCTGFTPVANTRYRVSITLTAGTWTNASIGNIKMGSFNMVGGASANGEVGYRGAAINADGTYTYEFNTVGTGALILSPSNLSRFTITNISIKTVTAATGQSVIEGDISTKGNMVFQGTLISPKIDYFSSLPSVDNLSFGGATPRFVQFTIGSSFIVTGLALNQVDGQELYFINNSPGAVLYVPHQSSSSTDVNRFQTASGADLALEYGSLAYIKYNGGSLNRWFAAKIGTGAAQFNGLTGGNIFGDFLNTLLANSDHMIIGNGNTQIQLFNDSGHVSGIGDVQSNGNRNKVIVDDDNNLIKLEAFESWRYRDPLNDISVTKQTGGGGIFTGRVNNLASNELISDESLDADSFSSIEPSAALEIRSTGVTDGAYRGLLLSRMTETARDSIASPAQGLLIYNTDSDILNFVGHGGTWFQLLQGGGTPNEIAYWAGPTLLASLPVGTYPSLTELSYVKGVTSAIQTQLNALGTLATANGTAQTAAKTTTTLFTPSATGFYRLSIYLQVTTAASISSVLGGATGVVWTYNDGDGNVAQSDTAGLMSPTGTLVTTLNTNTTTTNLNGTTVIYARTGVAVQFAIGYTSVGTAMQYAYHIRAEAV